jgi:hypothetical protein
MGMALSAIAEEQKKEEIVNSDTSTASVPAADPENSGDQKKPKDSEDSNPKKPEEKQKKVDENPESPADQSQQDDPQPEEPNQDGPKDDAPQHEGVQAPTTTENPSEMSECHFVPCLTL